MGRGGVSQRVSNHITLGSTSIWISVPLLTFIFNKNVYVYSNKRLNIVNLLYIIIVSNTTVVSACNWEIFVNYNVNTKKD